MANPDVAADATPCVAAVSASEERFMNFGSAVAARMPRITITTTSSINVKPFCFACISVLLFSKNNHFQKEVQYACLSMSHCDQALRTVQHCRQHDDRRCICKCR